MSKPKRCPKCLGGGVVITDPTSTSATEEECDYCDGIGWVCDDELGQEYCNQGSGYYPS